MPHPTPDTLGASRIALQVVRIGNAFTGVMLVLAIPASFLFASTFIDFFSKRPPRIDPDWLLPALRTWLLLALVMVTAVHVLLSRLIDMVATVRSGDPFVPENAARLKTIAWCVLTVQLLHLAFGLMAATVNAAGSNVEWTFAGFTGWIAVLLLFVLARVFEAGTQLRDDLGTMI